MDKPSKHIPLHMGQVIYILSAQGQNVIPAQVIEETSIKTLEGQSLSWKIAIGRKEDRKIIESTKINGEIFSDLNDVKKLLTTRLNSFIDNLIKTAQIREQKWYDKKPEVVVEQPKKRSVVASKPAETPTNDLVDPESLFVDVDEPEAPQQQSDGNHHHQQNEKVELRNKIKDMVAVDDQSDDDAATAVVVTPDGTRISVEGLNL